MSSNPERLRRANDPSLAILQQVPKPFVGKAGTFLTAFPKKS